MYNDEIRYSIIDSLESKAIDIVNMTVVLASKGYLVNKSKHIKLDWVSLLLAAFENINILSEEQQHNIELLYNKILTS